MMFYAVASAVLANEVDTSTELSCTQFSLLEILKSTFLSDIEAQAERAGGGRTLRNRKGRDAGPGTQPIAVFDKFAFWNIFPSII